MDLAVQRAGAGRGAPVNPVERVARLVGPNTSDSSRVLEEPMGHDAAARRSAGQVGEIVARQRDDFRVDQHEGRMSEHPEPSMQPEQVARLQHQRADLVIASANALQLILQHHLGAGAEHADPQALALHLEPGIEHIESAARQHVFEQQPGNRQRARVLDRDHHDDALADLQGQPAERAFFISFLFVLSRKPLAFAYPAAAPLQ